MLIEPWPRLRALSHDPASGARPGQSVAGNEAGPRILLADPCHRVQSHSTMCPPHVTIEIDAIAAMTDPTARAERTRRLFRDHSDLWLAETLISQLRVERVTAGMSNPGAPEISRLFESVGLEDVLDEVALTDGSDPAKRVNEFVGVRNSIAHGEGTKVTDDQVDRYLDAVECLGRSLDSAVARHVQSITGSPTLPWS